MFFVPLSLAILASLASNILLPVFLFVYLKKFNSVSVSSAVKTINRLGICLIILDQVIIRVKTNVFQSFVIVIVLLDKNK